MKKVLTLLIALLLSNGAFASLEGNQAACDKHGKSERIISFCYGVAHFDYLTPSRISHCGTTFKKDKVYSRCIDEAATSDISKAEITACKTSTSLEGSAINCLYAAANSTYLNEQDIEDCGRKASFPHTYAKCLKDAAGDLD